MEKDALIGQGRTADVFAWGQGRILKLYQSWMPATAVEQEYSATRAAQAAGMLVPVTYELVKVEGRHGIVFERIEGISLLAELQAKPWKLFSVARRLGELHAQIHEIQAPVELSTQRQQIKYGIQNTQDITEAEKQAVQNYLTQQPEGASLCHGDFHPDNILLSAQGPVTIDWMTGTRGHPPADVARTSLIIQTAGLPAGIPAHIRLFIDVSRALLYAIYLNRYLQLRPTERREIDRWRLPLIAARLREANGYPREKQLLLSQLKAMLNEPSQ
ncbi:MAG: phosphotransferase [Anaerolineae bacterium]|nr:phosphotransferase [Anaerolineae bacterium]